jgi:hypothetical protein
MSLYKNKGWEWLPMMDELLPNIGAKEHHAFVPTCTAARLSSLPTNYVSLLCFLGFIRYLTAGRFDGWPSQFINLLLIFGIDTFSLVRSRIRDNVIVDLGDEPITVTRLVNGVCQPLVDLLKSCSSHFFLKIFITSLSLCFDHGALSTGEYGHIKWQSYLTLPLSFLSSHAIVSRFVLVR